MIVIKPSYLYHWKKHYLIFINEESNCLYKRDVGKGMGRFKYGVEDGNSFTDARTRALSNTRYPL
jgi:hypothetical protein